MARHAKSQHRSAVVESLHPRVMFAGFEQVLDSGDTTGINETGGWARMTGVSVAYGGNHLLDSATKKGQQSVRFSPALPGAGDYQIFGWYRSMGSRSGAVPYVINTTTGDRTVFVDQRANGGRWVLLGTFQLAPGAGVTIHNQGTTGSVVADAIRFVQPVPTIPKTPDALLARYVDATVQLTWKPASDDATSFEINRRTSVNEPWTVIGTVDSSANLFIDASPTEHAMYRVGAINAVGASPLSLPTAAWSPATIGSVSAFTQTYSATNASITLGAAGGNLGQRDATNDALGMVWQKLSGDGQIVVRLSSLSATEPNAVAGVTVRQSLAEDSVHASLLVSKGGSALFTTRTTTGTGATTSVTTHSGAPRWLKLVRHGDVITAYRGTNGFQWSTVGRVNLAMSTDVYIGLTAASRSTTPISATFDSISIDDIDDDATGWTQLFNGQDLSGLYSYLPSRGVNDDPQGVFKVSNGELSILDIPATNLPVEFGYLATENEYANYRLRWEYKWGTNKFSPKQNARRDSGVIFHWSGVDQIWPVGPEFQVQEQDTGDAWLIGQTTARTNVFSTTATIKRYKEGGLPDVTQPADYRQVRRTQQVDTLTGWNRSELIVSGDDAVFIVNGVVMNKLFDIRRPDPSNPGASLPMTQGKILFQAEGATVAYRNIEIRPLNYDTAPEGADVLFNGDVENLNNWRVQRDGSPVTWQVVDGAMTTPAVSPEAGSIRSVQTYQDFTAHVEFRVPFDAPGKAEQLRGNSGIYLQGRYELQVLDSWNILLRGRNDAGALYDLADATSNAALPAETWQSFDITFTAARWTTEGTKIAPARVSVWWNGVLVQDDIALRGPTTLGTAESPDAGPLVLQSHWSAVQYRNVWVQTR